MYDFTQMLITVAVSLSASSGFWAWFMKKTEKKSATTQLLLGLAHDRIVFLGMEYIRRGWLTKDEYDDFIKYLYAPYANFGGNGLAEKIKDEVAKLPLRNTAEK